MSSILISRPSGSSFGVRSTPWCLIRKSVYGLPFWSVTVQVGVYKIRYRSSDARDASSRRLRFRKSALRQRHASNHRGNQMFNIQSVVCRAAILTVGLSCVGVAGAHAQTDSDVAAVMAANNGYY